tara:strand:+ start:97 stop:255 length:159 start_codon:yes stop_codon:yes gene_type:complete
LNRFELLAFGEVWTPENTLGVLVSLKNIFVNFGKDTDRFLMKLKKFRVINRK